MRSGQHLGDESLLRPGLEDYEDEHHRFRKCSLEVKPDSSESQENQMPRPPVPRSSELWNHHFHCRLCLSSGSAPSFQVGLWRGCCKHTGCSAAECEWRPPGCIPVPAPCTLPLPELTSVTAQHSPLPSPGRVTAEGYGPGLGRTPPGQDSACV